MGLQPGVLCVIKWIDMRSPKYEIAAVEMLLMFPATLFMAALFLRNVQPLEFEPAHTAQQIVTWYAGRPRIGLWGFSIAFPITALIIGCATLVRKWIDDSELRRAAVSTLIVIRSYLATLVVAGATVAAAGVLAIVALHVLTD